jgi:hypothetical protein
MTEPGNSMRLRERVRQRVQVRPRTISSGTLAYLYNLCPFRPSEVRSALDAEDDIYQRTTGRVWLTLATGLREGE